MQRLTASSSSVSSFSAGHPAAATVQLGESFELDTADCYNGQITSSAVLRPHIDMGQFNKATGPVAVAGVESGDVIRIEIEDVTLGAQGIMAVNPGLGVLGDQVEAPETRMVSVRDGKAWINERIGVPIRPMVGVLGVAPPSGADIPNAWPGDHGGNLDTRLLGPGSALLIRANQPGALVLAGDLHAVQGDGELGGTGVEISGTVRLRVDRSQYTGHLPAVHHSHGISILGSAETLELALRRAFDEAVGMMQLWHDLSWNDAYRLTSVVANGEVSQVVNPLVTARVTIPTEWCAPSVVLPADA